MNVLEKYNTARDEFYAHVGFVEDWVVYPIEDETDSFWDVIDNGETIKWSETIEKFDDDDGGEFYTADIYAQRFYSKHVYIGKDFTMIFGHPGVDGMKWFYVFDNKKRRSQIEKETRKSKLRKLINNDSKEI